jgi:glutathione S-transferase
LEYPELKPVLEQANVPPALKRDGTFGYTCPSIVDSSTGIAVSDSFKIAEYLDKQYPETPRAFPLSSIALQAAFNAQFTERIHASFSFIMVPKTPGILNPVSSGYYRETRGIAFGKPLVVPVGDELEHLWEKARETFDWLEGFYSMSGGPFFMGEMPSYADFILGGILEEMKILGDWESIKGLNGGRWERLRVDLEKYASTQN